MKFAIHCEPQIAWQPKRGAYIAEGLKRLGIPVEITNSRTRVDGIPILLGTTRWRAIERDGGSYLLVDRCSMGDTERFVSLVWDGHGRRGDHKVPADVSSRRWDRMGLELLPWKKPGTRIVLCGQTESYAPIALDGWYRSVPATHFRPHPSGENPTGLPRATDFEDAIAVTLNSSVGVQCVLNGIPTVTMDEGAMAWDVTGHKVTDLRFPDRRPWVERLSYTQWSDDELRDGTPWGQLLA